MSKDNGQLRKSLGGAAHIAGNVVGIALIAVMLPIMIVNMTLIIKSYVKPEKVPTFLGVAPLIVQSGSMEPTILVDDLIFTKEVDPNTLQERDIIAFQPTGEKTVVTHRIVEAEKENNVPKFTMRGDYNNTNDAEPVYGPQVVGKYIYRIGGVGKVAMFLQQPIGMVVCVAVPLALFLVYDMVRRLLYNKKNKKQGDSEKEELERLRALAAQLEAGDIPAEFAPAPTYIPEDAPSPASRELPQGGAWDAYPPLPGEEDLVQPEPEPAPAQAQPQEDDFEEDADEV